MATKKNLKDMTVPELKELADKKGVEIPSDATKAEIIAALESAGGNGGGVEGAPERDEEAINQQSAEEIEKHLAEGSYEGFADPVVDGSKPILDVISPGNVVVAVVVDGSTVLTPETEPVEDQDHLVFVQSGRSQEWLTSAAAKRKFGQDKEGQIYYNQHGFDPAVLKPVDVVALGT